MTEFHTGTKILCGSHNKHLYCWNQNLKLEWRTELDSAVYCIPTRATGYDGVQCVCVCSSSGVLYLVNASNGLVLTKMQLPNEVFSSPVCVDNCIVLGCRDDYVYCIEVATSTV